MRPAEHVRYLVLAAQREGNRSLTGYLKPLGLSPAQAEVLRILGDHEPLTLTGLGRLLVCDSGTNPSRLVDRLVDSGLVERREADEDRRQVTLTLTAAGRQQDALVREIEDRFYEELDAALAGIDVDLVIAFFGRLVAGQPAGVALAERITAGDRA
jgi:DNA-binding MarR family transcriptional regulator